MAELGSRMIPMQLGKQRTARWVRQDGISFYCIAYCRLGPLVSCGRILVDTGHQATFSRVISSGYIQSDPMRSPVENRLASNCIEWGSRLRCISRNYFHEKTNRAPSRDSSGPATLEHCLMYPQNFRTLCSATQCEAHRRSLHVTIRLPIIEVRIVFARSPQSLHPRPPVHLHYGQSRLCHGCGIAISSV